jgi:transcriptional regulator with XRE-family HTH domain
MISHTMNTTAENPEKGIPKTTTRRYASVAALMGGEGVPDEIREAVSELEKETHLTAQLTRMRIQAGLTQEEMAEAVGCTQGCVSKWESGRDEDLDIKTIRAYTKATGQRVGVLIGQPLNHAEAIKIHVAGIQKRLLALAKLSHANGELQAEINNFFGEFCLNIFSVMADASEVLPKNGDVEVRIQLFETKLSKPMGKKEPCTSKTTVLA